MSMDYIRKTYGVAYKRGDRVRFAKPGQPAREGAIMGARYGYLRIKLDPRPGQIARTKNFHPTWCLEPLPVAAAQAHP